MALRDVKDRVESVKNVQKITRAMEMVAAARLRKAEQRIAALRPYADAIRMMTRKAASASEHIPSLPVMQRHEEEKTVGILMVTGDRGLAGVFNAQILRAGTRLAKEYKQQGLQTSYFVAGRRGVSSLTFRGYELASAYAGFSDKPAYDDARQIAADLMTAYVDGKLDRVEIVYNGYVSALTQEVRREVVLPLQEATIFGEITQAIDEGKEDKTIGALVEYEPEPEALLHRLIPEYVEISIFRALLESAASEHGARMTAMRNASGNAGDLIENLTLEMNRARQAEITQEIMEVVAGAEAQG